MQKLADVIVSVADEPNKLAGPALLDAAKEWSMYCLENMTGDLLNRGLAISAAIANFDCGARNPETLKD